MEPEPCGLPPPRAQLAVPRHHLLHPILVPVAHCGEPSPSHLPGCPLPLPAHGPSTFLTLDQMGSGSQILRDSLFSWVHCSDFAAQRPRVLQTPVGAAPPAAPSSASCTLTPSLPPGTTISPPPSQSQCRCPCSPAPGSQQHGPAPLSSSGCFVRGPHATGSRVGDLPGRGGQGWHPQNLAQG